MYTAPDAVKAYLLFLMAIGYTSRAMNALPSTTWTDHDGYKFTCHNSGHSHTKISWTVHFVDEHGNAEVISSDGESGTVNIGSSVGNA
jgi:hypothetical protein